MAQNNTNNDEGIKKWELRSYEIQRTPQVVRTDHTEIKVPQNTIGELVRCPICLDTLKNTMIAKGCGHRFCNECINTALRSNNRECPTCRDKIASKRSLTKDPNFDALVQLLVKKEEKDEQTDEQRTEELLRQTRLRQKAFSEMALRQAARQKREDNESAKKHVKEVSRKKSTEKSKPTAVNEAISRTLIDASSDKKANDLSISTSNYGESDENAAVSNGVQKVPENLDNYSKSVASTSLPSEVVMPSASFENFKSPHTGSQFPSQSNRELSLPAIQSWKEGQHENMKKTPQKTSEVHAASSFVTENQHKSSVYQPKTKKSSKTGESQKRKKQYDCTKNKASKHMKLEDTFVKPQPLNTISFTLQPHHLNKSNVQINSIFNCSGHTNMHHVSHFLTVRNQNERFDDFVTKSDTSADGKNRQKIVFPRPIPKQQPQFALYGLKSPSQNYQELQYTDTLNNLEVRDQQLTIYYRNKECTNEEEHS